MNPNGSLERTWEDAMDQPENSFWLRLSPRNSGTQRTIKEEEWQSSTIYAWIQHLQDKINHLISCHLLYSRIDPMLMTQKMLNRLFLLKNAVSGNKLHTYKKNNARERLCVFLAFYFNELCSFRVSFFLWFRINIPRLRQFLCFTYARYTRNDFQFLF